MDVSPRMCISWRIINVASGVSAPGPRYKQGTFQKAPARVKSGGFLRRRTTLSAKWWVSGKAANLPLELLCGMGPRWH